MGLGARCWAGGQVGARLGPGWGQGRAAGGQVGARGVLLGARAGQHLGAAGRLGVAVAWVLAWDVARLRNSAVRHFAVVFSSLVVACAHAVARSKGKGDAASVVPCASPKVSRVTP